MIDSLVFEGGGILGIAYLGTLDYLYENNLMKNITRVAGTSAGAIMACITSFNLNFDEINKMAMSLDYRKIPDKSNDFSARDLSELGRLELEKIFGDINCLYRLIKNYGWYSSSYFYKWIKEIIANQFDQTKKAPPYTFADFKNNSIHLNNQPFLELYVVGTNVAYHTSNVFSYETTPNMEVAEAITISMSIPLYFEAIKKETNVFADGGIMRNYPINIFDKDDIDDHSNTLGIHFRSRIKYHQINNILDYIINLFYSMLQVQQDYYNHNIEDKDRSIEIDIHHVSPLQFNITNNDKTYNYLYNQGYKAAMEHFDHY